MSKKERSDLVSKSAFSPRELSDAQRSIILDELSRAAGIVVFIATEHYYDEETRAYFEQINEIFRRSQVPTEPVALAGITITPSPPVTGLHVTEDAGRYVSNAMTAAGVEFATGDVAERIIGTETSTPSDGKEVVYILVGKRKPS